MMIKLHSGIKFRNRNSYKCYLFIFSVAFVFTLVYILILLNNFRSAEAVANSIQTDLSPLASIKSASNAISAETDPPVQKLCSDFEYVDENIQITISNVTESNSVYYVADIRLNSMQYFKTAFAFDKFGRNMHEATSIQANRHNAIFAINGDYYGARDSGLVIRNGTLYRDNSNRDSLVLMQNGEMRVVDKNTSGKSLINEGAFKSWSFGPVLVKDGENVIGESNTDREDPRTGIGMIEPFHYIFICVDGRLPDSKGLKLIDFAQLFIEYGCSVAYNLDGGGTATMLMNSKIINRPCYGKERKISDIVYIGLE